jgi:SEC-C motif-containing protein
MKSVASEMICPCNPRGLYQSCCQPYHEGVAIPQTPEQLMRSRYSAYVRQDWAYLSATWHETTRPTALELAESHQPMTQWLGLAVHGAGVVNDAEMEWVKFTARYRINGRARRIDEASRFIRENERWYYVDGIDQTMI